MKLPHLICCSLLLTSCLAASGMAADKKEDMKEPTPEQAREFSQRLSNTVLTGRFTFDDKMEAVPKPESYEIKNVSDAGGGLWTFLVRIKYGKVDVNLPVTVPVVWADGTPMVSLKNATIPGMGGGFSAHVIFEGNRYAGTWQHNSKGGHLFGTIKKAEEKSPSEAEAPKQESEEKPSK